MLAQFANYLHRRNIPTTNKSAIVRLVLTEFSRALDAAGQSIPGEQEADLILSGVQFYSPGDVIMPELASMVDTTKDTRIRTTLDLLNQLEAEEDAEIDSASDSASDNNSPDDFHTQEE